ncbi:MAG: hypothetical protein V8T01_03460 [Oscillospiraceae bacterium]
MQVIQAVDEGEEDPVRLENIPCAVQLRQAGTGDGRAVLMMIRRAVL